MIEDIDIPIKLKKYEICQETKSKIMFHCVIKGYVNNKEEI
jgi:hypothetical protein